MTTTPHPTLESLSGYILSPQDEAYRDVRQHLMDCDQCRLRSDRLSALTQQIQHQVPLYKTQPETAEKDLGTDSIIQQSLSMTEAQRTAVKQSPTALKAALHSLTHSAAMQRGLQSPTTPATFNEKNTSLQQPGFMERLQQWFKGLNPAWIGVPATAVLLFALTVFFLPMQNHGTFIVAAYQDNPVVTFQPSDAQRPGIGFFSNIPSHSQAFAPVRIHIGNNNTLTLQWPAVTKVVDYTVQISIIENETQTQLLLQTTNKLQVRFTGFKPRKGKRYTWRITGSTSDKQRFEAEGGFVIQ
jgi:hypothetical protein